MDTVRKLLLLVILLSIPCVGTYAQEQETLIILGDSLTAGYGIAAEQAYPALLQKKATAEGKNLKVINGGLSGDTTAGGLRRLSWLLKVKPDVFVVALGANDGLRGLSPQAMKENLGAIIQKVRERYPAVKVAIAGMEMPPNMGEQYRSEYRRVFHEVAEEQKVFFVPFLLEGVAGHPELNQADRIHPNEEGHTIIAEQLWPTLKKLLVPSNE